MSRDRAIRTFLRQNGHDPDRARPLAQDASFRRYLALDGTAILMDAPPPEDIRPFARIAAHLAAIGVSVPRVLATDEGHGLLIEEYLGDQMFTASPASETVLIDAAVDVLVAMQRAAPPSGLPAWGKPEMKTTALGTLFDWWWPAMHGQDAPDDARAEVADALDVMLDHVAKGPVCFVHRDFFAGNLIWLPDRTGPRRAGVIDFQSAALGHPGYDLASLTQDSRRVTSPDLEDRAIARYLAARPDLDPIAFRHAYDACAAQRHLRVACQWVRLAKRDNRPHYLSYGPNTWAMLTRALSRPAAAPLAAALDRWIPPQQRRNPHGLTE